MKLATVDYETMSIEDRPDYPPIPVGVAIKEGTRRHYMAWGHPEENNCTKAQAVKVLRKLFRTHECIFHNAAFDIDVGEVHLKLPPPRVFHDTEFLAYLDDPRSPSLALKKLAENLLGMPPDEQTELKEWILENVPGATEKGWGAFICEAPGKLVGRYAIGDVVRTERLFKKLYPKIKREGMLDAYMREIQVVRIRLEMEREGIRTNHRKLKRDVRTFERAYEKLESRIKRRLRITKKYESECPKGFFNFNSSTQLAEALERSGKVKEFIYTQPSKSFPQGQPSTKIENLQKVCKDKKLLLDLGMRSVLNTYLTTFMNPWIELGERTDGYIYPTFNQVRSTDEHGGRGTKGTKTGRPSSSNPNLNNIPADVEESKNRDTLIALAKYLREFKVNFVGLRDYLIPDPGCVFIDRDYNQQEVRILAHYEDGALLEAYLEDPRLDVHTFAQELIYEQLGILFPRKSIKITGFSIIYGSGILKLSLSLDCPYDEAKKIKNAYLAAFPGIKDLNKELKDFARKDKPIRTWGGRLYFCEEPEFVRGKWKSYEYKLLNLLIQGSAADITKQAMIQVNEACEGRIVAQVYDEILMCTDIAKAERDMNAMREAMENIQLDVPLPTDGAWSKQSWGRMKPWPKSKGG